MWQRAAVGGELRNVGKLLLILDNKGNVMGT